MNRERVTAQPGRRKAADALPGALRRRLRDHGIFSLNLISSPSSGKTTLLERTIERLKDRLSLAVIAGDVQSERDAERLRRHGVPVYAIETGGRCHLEARQIAKVLKPVDLVGLDLLFIENVGSLICTSAYDLGETVRLVLVSVTEGEDTALKYPGVFRKAGALVITKIDLASFVNASVDRIIDHARASRPDLPAFPTSSYTGEGFEDWLDWLCEQVEAHKAKTLRAGVER